MVEEIKNPVGTPPKEYKKEFMGIILPLFEDFVFNSHKPSIYVFIGQNQELIYKYKYDFKSFLYDNEEFSSLLKIANAKRISYLQEQGLMGTIDKTMAIFELKQHGQSDRQHIDMNASVNTEDVNKVKGMPTEDLMEIIRKQSVK